MNKYFVKIPYSYSRYGTLSCFVFAEDSEEAEDLATSYDNRVPEDYDDGDSDGDTEYDFSDMTVELDEEDVDSPNGNNNPGVELIEKAIRICCEAHKGQRRKGDGKMYYIHPIMVALKRARYGASDESIAAALTHDVLEDTDYPRETLREELGNRVFEMVEALTQIDKLSYRVKKLGYIDSVRNAGTDVKLISVADKIHNLESLIMAHKVKEKDIWELFNGCREDKVWFEENLLEMLKSTKHPLIDEYKSLIVAERKLV